MKSSRLFVRPVDGGAEVQVAERVLTFQPASGGIYYVTFANAPSQTRLEFLDEDTGRSRTVLHIGRPVRQFTQVAVSPDQKSFLIPVYTRYGSDLMMIENFR
jgi:hypothetical protein